MTRQKRLRNISRQIFIQRIVIFLLRIEKRTTFVHVRNRVVDSACLNLCLLEFTARTLRGFVFKILGMYDLKQNLLSNNTFGT